jgi:catecholate siderophore receptor
VGIKSFAKALESAALLGASSLALSTFYSAPALAEDAGADDPIVVTGQRDAQSNRYTAPLADTPHSVTVIPPQVLDQTGVVTFQEALRTIPGITMGSGEGGASAGDRPFIRGIDSTNDIFVDGVRDSGSTTREVFNTEQIEVSRGPGGAFTGRGSTGGSINIVSKSPRAENFANANVTLGADNAQRVTGDVNYYFGNGAALRINGMHHDADVAGRDDVELHRWGIAPSLAFGLGSDTRTAIYYYHLETDDMPDYGIPYLRHPTITDPIYGPIVFATPITGHDEDFYGLLNRDFRRTQADIGTVKLEHDFGDNLTLSNTFRYGDTSFHQVVTNPDDSRGNVVNGELFRGSKSRGIDVTTIADVLDLHGTIHTGPLEHSFDVGFEYSNEQTHNQNYAVNGPGLPATFGFPFVPTSGVLSNTFPAGPNCTNPGALGAPSPAQFNCTSLNNPNAHDPWVGTVARSVGYTDTETEVYAAYIFDTIEFNDQWSFNWGIRYDHFNTDQTGLTAPAPTSVVPNPVLSIPAPLNREDEFVNYQLGLVYKPTRAGTLYIAYGTSTDPSGEGGGDASALTSLISILPPEENRSIEAGVKWQLFDSLLATAAIFRTEKTNARVTDDTGATDTIGNQRIDGLELTLSGNITDQWSVFGGYTYLNSEVIDGGFFDRGASAIPRFVPSPANGNDFPNTPHHAFSLWTSYAITPAFIVGGGASYMSQRFADANNRITIPSYWRYDAMASYRLTHHVDLQLNLLNLSDERYITNPFQTHMAQIAPGRSALFSLNLHY